MRGRSGILSPRQGPAGLDDLAEPSPLIVNQRVRSRWTRRAVRRAPGLVLRLALGAVLLSGQLALLHWLLASPRFAVSQVEVSGLGWLGEAEVRALAAIEAGQNLFGLDAEAVARRLEHHPRIKKAQLIRSFPSRVTLLIEERQSFALALRAGRLYWLDEQGVVLGPEPRAVAPGLPVITGLWHREAVGSPTLRAERPGPAIALLRTILRTATPLASELSEIDVREADDGPVLYTVDGIEVRLGAEGWEEQLARLEGVLAQIRAQAEPIESIDLRFRDQVVLKPKG